MEIESDLVKNPQVFSSPQQNLGHLNTKRKLESLYKKDPEMETETKNEQRKIVKVKSRKTLVESKTSETQTERRISLKFRKIFTLENKELVNFCLENEIITKPPCCHTCRKRSGKIKELRLSASKNYPDGVIWRCKDRNCGGIKSIRSDNFLLEKFKNIKLRLLLIFIFTHFTVMLCPIASCLTLGLSLRTIRELYSVISNWIIQEQMYVENIQGRFGGTKTIVEMDESCFFWKEK